MAIPIGTLCFIVRTTPDNAYLIGRVVEVVTPALPLPETEGVAMHRIDAPWLRSEMPGVRCYAEPSSLLPITPPDPEEAEASGMVETVTTVIERRTSEPVQS